MNASSIGGAFRANAAAMAPEALEIVAARFRAMGEPLRLRILQTLERGQTSVSALALEVGSTQPNVSRHLKVLQDAGLIDRRQRGNAACYFIADPMVFELCAMMCAGIRGRLEKQVAAFPAEAVRARKGATGRGRPQAVAP